ncbi:MAG: hypothetical protein ABIJ39_09925 [Chloroflexota bacterium]
MTDLEREQVLKMIEDGKITPEEGLGLIRALEEDPPLDDHVVIPPAMGQESRPDQDPALREVGVRARRLWQVFLWIGIVVTVLSGALMFWAMQAAGYNFWFFCAWLPFILGVVMISMAAGGRNSRWLYVNVEPKPGKKEPHIVLGFPLPLKFAAWFLRTFGDKIPELKNTSLDEIIQAVETFDASTADNQPLIVSVDDGDDGERVQVYIG